MTLTTPFCPNVGTSLVIGQPYDPTAISAVEAQGTLLTTAGKRLRMLVAVLLLTLSVRGLMHRHHDHGYGHWANATDDDAAPSVIVPCSVDLSEVLESAGVTGVDASMIHLAQHGCCGDEICGLGENSESCAVDCTEGSTGQLVWREDERHHHHGHHHHEDWHDHSDSGDDDDAAYSERRRHGRRDDGDSDDDTQGPDAVAADSDGDTTLGTFSQLDDEHTSQSETGHRHGGKRHHHGNHTSDWARGHGHRSALAKKVTSGAMGVLGLVLLVSIRASWVAVLRDFCTFFFPSCGCRDSASKMATTSYGGTLEAEASDSKGEGDVVTTI